MALSTTQHGGGDQVAREGSLEQFLENEDDMDDLDFANELKLIDKYSQTQKGSNTRSTSHVTPVSSVEDTNGPNPAFRVTTTTIAVSNEPPSGNGLFLKRPPSSGIPPTAGFEFAKAEKVSLDFRGRTRRTSFEHVARIDNRLSGSPHTRQSASPPPANQEMGKAQEASEVAVLKDLDRNTSDAIPTTSDRSKDDEATVHVAQGPRTSEKTDPVAHVIQELVVKASIDGNTKTPFNEEQIADTANVAIERVENVAPMPAEAVSLLHEQDAEDTNIRQTVETGSVPPEETTTTAEAPPTIYWTPASCHTREQHTALDIDDPAPLSGPTCVGHCNIAEEQTNKLPPPPYLNRPTKNRHAEQAEPRDETAASGDEEGEDDCSKHSTPLSSAADRAMRLHNKRRNQLDHDMHRVSHRAKPAKVIKASQSRQQDETKRPKARGASAKVLQLMFEHIEREEIEGQEREAREAALRKEVEDKDRLLQFFDGKICELVTTQQNMLAKLNDYARKEQDLVNLTDEHEVLQREHQSLKQQASTWEQNQKASAQEVRGLQSRLNESAKSAKAALQRKDALERQLQNEKKALADEQRTAQRLEKEVKEAKEHAAGQWKSAIDQSEARMRDSLAEVKQAIDNQPKFDPTVFETLKDDIKSLAEQPVDLAPLLDATQSTKSSLDAMAKSFDTQLTELKHSQSSFATQQTVEDIIKQVLTEFRAELNTCRSLQAEVRKLHADNTALERSTAGQSSTIASMESSRAEIQLALDDSNKRVSEAEEKLRLAEARPSVDPTALARLHEADKELAELRATRNRLEAELKQHKAEQESSTTQQTSLQADNEALQSNIARLNEQIGGFEASQVKLKHDTETATRDEMHKTHKQSDQEQIRKHTNEIHQAKQELARARTALQTVQKELDDMRISSESVAASKQANETGLQNKLAQLSESRAHLEQQLKASKAAEEAEKTARQSLSESIEQASGREKAAREKELIDLRKQLDAAKVEVEQTKTEAAQREANLESSAQLQREELMARVHEMEERIRQQPSIDTVKPSIEPTTGITQLMDVHGIDDPGLVDDTDTVEQHVFKSSGLNAHHLLDDTRITEVHEVKDMCEACVKKPRRKVTRSATWAYADTEEPGNISQAAAANSQTRLDQSRNRQHSEPGSDLLFNEFVYEDMCSKPSSRQGQVENDEEVVQQTQFSGPTSLHDMREVLAPTQRQNLRSASYDFATGRDSSYGSALEQQEHVSPVDRPRSKSLNPPNSAVKVSRSMTIASTKPRKGGQARQKASEVVMHTTNRAERTMPITWSARRFVTKENTVANSGLVQSPHFSGPLDEDDPPSNRAAAALARKRKASGVSTDLSEASKKQKTTISQGTEPLHRSFQKTNRIAPSASHKHPTRRHSRATGGSAVAVSSQAQPSLGVSPYKKARREHTTTVQLSQGSQKPGKLSKVTRRLSSRGSNFQAYTPGNASQAFAETLRRTASQQ